MKRTFRVGMGAHAAVQGYATVEAETQEEAERLAIKQARDGDIEWTYCDIEYGPIHADNDIEVNSVLDESSCEMRGPAELQLTPPPS
jgi:hypothetical protein